MWSGEVQINPEQQQVLDEHIREIALRVSILTINV